jgi:hypothetical protein
VRAFIQWLRDILSAFRKGGGTKFARKRRGRAVAAGPRGSAGVKTRKKGRRGSLRCDGCDRFVRSLCTTGEEPCGVCPDCCLGHEDEDQDAREGSTR